MKYLSLLLLFLLPALCRGQIITTVAGTGSGGPLGDGGAATAAPLASPVGIVCDRSNNIYIADGNHHRVRKVDGVTGIITTIAGTGTAGYNGDGIPATAAMLNNPGFLAVFDTFLYISEVSYRIRRVNLNTTLISTYAGTGTAGYNGDNTLSTMAQINDNCDIVVDLHGNLYINDAGNFRVRKVNGAGVITTIMGTGIALNTGDNGPATSATISGNMGICVDRGGNVYVTDSAASVRKINATTGIVTRVAGLGDHTAGIPYSGDGNPATNSRIEPFDVAVDDTGNLYIADYGNSRVEKVDTFGIIHTITGNGTFGFSGDGGPAFAATINRPENLAFDTCGNLLLTDFGNRRVRKIWFNSCFPLRTAENSNSNMITIYPNPTTHLLNIDSEDLTAYTLKNIFGIPLQQGALHSGHNSINTGSLPAGIYLLEVTNQQGQRTIRRIVKQ